MSARRSRWRSRSWSWRRCTSIPSGMPPSTVAASSTVHWCRSTPGLPAPSGSATRRAGGSPAAWPTCGDQGGQRLRPPARGSARLRRHGPGRGARSARPGGRAPAVRARELLPRAQRPAAHRPQAAGDHPARGPELRGGRQPRALAEVVAADRHGPAGRPRAVDGRVRGRRADPAHRLPGVGQRDGRALRAPRSHARLEERLRRRRMGPGPHGQLPDARLRLPRRDPLLRRRLCRRARQAAHAGQRHLHARGGLRHPLEARRHGLGAHRGAAVASTGRELHRHGGQLRVRLLLVLLPRWHHAARSEADRDHVHHGRGRRRSGRPRPDDRPGPGGALPPAPVQRPARYAGRRPRQRGVRGRRGAHRFAGKPRESVGERVRHDGDAVGERAGGAP